jgi:myo-inositol-1(or 4)-monophosphatase
MKNLNEVTQNVATVAKKAGELLKSRFRSNLNVSHKGTVDLVTEMDIAAEKLIKEELHKLYPEVLFFGEESGGDNWKQGLVWVVDPLDGTTNYACGLDHFAVSIALCKDGEPIVGVINKPMTNDLYSAWKDGGAYLNDKKISVSKVADISEALAVTGFPYNRREVMDELLARLRVMMNHVQGIRRLGSAALDLCYVANGTFSIFWETNLKPWDVAAGLLLVNEAGGKVTRFNGSKMYLDTLELLATNNLLHPKSIELLTQ